MRRGVVWLLWGRDGLRSQINHEILLCVSRSCPYRRWSARVHVDENIPEIVATAYLICRYTFATAGLLFVALREISKVLVIFKFPNIYTLTSTRRSRHGLQPPFL